jgi:two-component system, response regulator PdtaR
MAEADEAASIVLVAEDETLVRLLVNDVLTDAGYRVLEARDGHEALTILGLRDDVQALLTDITMPNVDGMSLARIVSERWPHIGIVVMSAATFPSDLPKGVRFVSKPCSNEKLVREIEAALAARTSAAPIALTSTPTLHGGQVHGAGGLAQPLREPEE